MAGKYTRAALHAKWEGAETPQYAVMAQLVERLSCKQQVEGSKPSGGSKADDPLKYPAGAQAGVRGRHPRAPLHNAYHAGLFYWAVAKRQGTGL